MEKDGKGTEDLLEQIRNKRNLISPKGLTPNRPSATFRLKSHKITSQNLIYGWSWTIGVIN